MMETETCASDAPFNALTLQRIFSPRLAPTGRLPILHRDRGAQRVCADSSLLRQSARCPGNARVYLKMRRQRFRSRHSSQLAMCRRSRRPGARYSMLENHCTAEVKIPASTTWKNRAVAKYLGRGPAMSPRIGSGSTYSNGSIAPAWNRLRIPPLNERCSADG